MSKTLYLMRHGQTMFNLRGKVQGASDSPSSELGISQAQKASQYFNTHNIHFDALFSSSSERACDTLEHAVPNRAYQRLKGLKEWNFGLFEGDSTELLDAIWDNKDVFGDRLVPFGGDAKEAVEERLNDTLTEIMEGTAGSTVLAVSHGTAIQIFLRKWMRNALTTEVFIGNCHILKFEYDEHQFKLLNKVDPITNEKIEY